MRRSVEILVQDIDRLDADSSRDLLKVVSEKKLYEAAVTVMMRLVFLLSAEERGLLRLGQPEYDAAYAVSTLREQLREVADRQGEEVLQYRFDAWTRLLATFRAVYGGVQHEALKLPAYKGSLFDPDRFLFLEGPLSKDDEPDPLKIRCHSYPTNDSSWATRPLHDGCPVGDFDYCVWLGVPSDSSHERGT